MRHLCYVVSRNRQMSKLAVVCMVWALVRCCVLLEKTCQVTVHLHSIGTPTGLAAGWDLWPLPSPYRPKIHISQSIRWRRFISTVIIGTRLNWCRISVHLSHRRNTKTKGVRSHLTLPKAPMPKVLLSRYRPMTTGAFSIPSSLSAPVSPSFFHQRQYLPSVPLTRLRCFTGYRL